MSKASAKASKSAKTKRNDKGQFRHDSSVGVLAAMWAAGVISLGLVWLAARAVMSDFGSFRSCNDNTGILTVSSCGKHSLNLGDFIMLGLLALTACLSVSLLTAAWRMTRKGKVIA